MAQSLTRIYLQVILVLVACLAAIGYAGYLAIRDMQQSAYLDRVSRVTVEIASRIDALVTGQRQSQENIAAQSHTMASLAHATGAERSRLENEIRSHLPGAVSVKLFAWSATGPSDSDGETDPALHNYLKRVAGRDSPAAPEFRRAAKAADQYHLAVPVRDGKRDVSGYLLAEYSVASLQGIFKQSLPSNGYLELQQSVGDNLPQTMMTAGGGPALRGFTVTSEIQGGRWLLMYQDADVPPPILSGYRKFYFAVAMAAFVLILMILFRLYRRTVKSIQHDIQSLIRMFRDLREGSVRVSYPMALKEFSEIFEYLRDRGQKLVKEKEKLKDMGLMDHLSQLSNRRHFEARLKELFESSRANGPSSVLIIDMDHFKAVNDKHGHDAGDALIVGFANALRKVVRQTDVLARLGGDEFCIIYTYAPLAKATELADRLRRHMPREITLTKGVVHQARWTGGLSTMHDKDTKPDDVLWRADQALLQAKEAGRNNTKVYDPSKGTLAKKKILAG